MATWNYYCDYNYNYYDYLYYYYCYYHYYCYYYSYCYYYYYYVYISSHQTYDTCQTCHSLLALELCRSKEEREAVH
jgi:hypothetical protein